MIAAVPQLKEEVVQNVPVVIVDTDSDNETAREPAPQNQPLAMARFVVIPGHAKDLDSRCQVHVRSILDDPEEEWSVGKDFSWDDESPDPAVDTLVRLIGECFVFRKEMFKGGLTAADINRLRGNKNKDKEGKDNHDRERPERESNLDQDPDEDHSKLPRGSRLADIVASKVREELLGMEARILAGYESQVESDVGGLGIDRKISEIHKAVSSLKGIEGRVNENLSIAVKAMQENVSESIISFLRNSLATEPPSHESSPSPYPSADSPPPRNDETSAQNSPGKRSGEVPAAEVPDVSDAQLESPAQRPGPSSVPEIPTCPNAAVRKVLDDLNAGDITGTGGSDGYDAQEALNVYDPEEATEGPSEVRTEKETVVNDNTGASESSIGPIEMEGPTQPVTFPEVEDPSFSLGVTQEATCQEVVIATPIGYAIPPPTV
ncbi:Uncharacterized protein Rs2_04665 [Raphanus sativus]|nr:Uncharacterized protein Rs2_04665 [Raphanus sativus]